MTLQHILFFVIAAMSLGAAMMTVSARNLVHAALWLIVTLFGVAVLFVLLNAAFLAIVQVVIYIGAIAILMIFAIMLTRRVMQDSSANFNSGWPLAALLALILFGGLGFLLSQWGGFSTVAPNLPANLDPLRSLGTALVSPDAYVLPFEVASVLLLAALIGAMVVAAEQ